MKRLGAVILVFAAIVGSHRPASADDWSDCAATARPKVAISACTGLISQGLAGNRQAMALAYFDRGAAHSSAGEFDKAIADYDQAATFNPDDARIYNGRGVAHAYKGDLAAAIADYGRAIAVDPQFLDPLNNRADAYRRKGDLRSAVADLNRAIALDPAFVEAWYTRGESYLDLGDLVRAKADLTQAMTLDAAGAHRDYGQLLLAEIVRRTAEAAAPVATAPATAAKTNERRVALVIGNANYQAVSALKNPANDAETVAAALRQTGFTDVTVIHDADRTHFLDALKAFAKEADNSDWAIVYYAGHGMEIGGENYAVPIDAQLLTDRDVPDEAISLDRIEATIEKARRLRLIILDACRNNPFLAKMKVSSATRAIGRGLALVEPTQATLVAYSAKAGTLASDGNSTNSPFAAAFANRITEPGVEINKIFRFVRSDVLAATDNEQEPFVYGSLPPEDFFFLPPK